jgi:hypothetical protein
MPNAGSKEPPQMGKTCCGEDLSHTAKVKRLELKWLLEAYQRPNNPRNFSTRTSPNSPEVKNATTD